jgi:hypothetical protein
VSAIIIMSAVVNDERIFTEAAAITGLTPEQLHEKAVQTFASMLLHAGRKPGKFVWTVIRVGDQQFPSIDTEVDVPPWTASREKRAIEELLLAAKCVRDHLDRRITESPDNAVPVFFGLAELHAAINRFGGRI